MTGASAGHYISVFEVNKGRRQDWSLNKCAQTWARARTRIMLHCFRVFHRGENLGHDPKIRMTKELNCRALLAEQFPHTAMKPLRTMAYRGVEQRNITKMVIETRIGTPRPDAGCELTAQKWNSMRILSPFIICNLCKSCRIARM